MTPIVTIIICTYNRGFLIKETLPTLFNQDIDSNLFDIIIVDNNSDDDTSMILKDFQNQYSNLKIIKETNQGLSHAKNAGMVASNTDWIVYLDDDAKVPMDFVPKVLSNIENSNYSCFGGVYLPWYKFGKPKWFRDKYASNKNELVTFCTLDKEFASGGIMAIKRNLLLKYDGFSTDIGMKGNNTAYGEETLLQIKLRKDGYQIGYDPNWIMYHVVSDYKLSPWWFLKSGYHSGKDFWTIYEKEPSFKLIIKYIYRALKYLFINIFKYTPNIFNNNYYIQNWIIDTLRPFSIKFGQIIGGFRFIYSPND